MQRILLPFFVTLLAAFSTINVVAQQPDTSNPTSVDPKLLEWKNARITREYTIADVKLTGVKHLDSSIVYSITNLQPGDKFTHPGEDIFAKAIAALWRQKFFSAVNVYVTQVKDDKVWVEVNVTERPRLGNFKFFGVKKTEEEEILTKVNLAKQTIITENTRRHFSFM
jgi:outer membrane protein insertion porin family